MNMSHKNQFQETISLRKSLRKKPVSINFLREKEQTNLRGIH